MFPLNGRSGALEGVEKASAQGLVFVGVTWDLRWSACACLLARCSRTCRHVTHCSLNCVLSLCRFSKLAVAEQPALFCTEKQAIDKQVMAGIEHKVPKPTPHHGQSAPYDPRDNEVTLIKHYRQQDLRERRQRREATEFQRLLKTIPKVDYFPTTRLAEMYAKAGVLDSQGSFTGGGGGDGDGSSLGVDSAAVAGMGVGQHSVSTPVEAGDVGGSTSNGVGVANASVGGRTAGGSVYSNILQVAQLRYNPLCHLHR